MRPERAALLAAALALAACSHPPEWREVQAPPPSAVSSARLVTLELPGSNLRIGVDPGSVSIGQDSVVRYVVVAMGEGGTVTAMQEGIRCSTAEVKVYARHYPDTGWRALPDADWKPLSTVGGQRHSHFIARNGACVGHGPSRSADQFLRDLAMGSQQGDRRFSN